MKTKRPQAEPNYARRRYFGTLLLASVLICTVAMIVSLSAGIYQQDIEAFSVVPRQEYIPSRNPIKLAEAGQPPDSSLDHPQQSSLAIAVIDLFPDHIDLRIAGKTIKQIPLSRPLTTLAELHSTIHDPTWLDEIKPGELTLKAALVIKADNDFSIKNVKQLTLLRTPSVFIAAENSKLTFDHVAISGETTSDSAYRPFILATNNATLNIYNSTFSHLGWDWNASYGVSWVEDSTGEAIDSTFEQSLIGAYTSHAHDLTFRGDTFRGNDLYGLDPHTYSSRLTIDHVTAENNKAHGIIFSDHVTDSRITSSVAKNNGENGIMLDKESTNNEVTENRSENNTGDGIVTAASPDNFFSDNSLENNRIGLRIDPNDVASSVFVGNILKHNAVASQGLHVTSAFAIDNGSQWNWPVVKRAWLTAGAAIVLVALGLVILQRKHPNRLYVIEQHLAVEVDN